MGGLKKGKGSSKGKGGKGKDSKGSNVRRPNSHQEDGREILLPPQERVAAVRPFWETLTHEERVELLSITVDDLRARSKDVVARLRRQAAAEAAELEAETGEPGEIPWAVNLEPTVEELLEEGIKRLHSRDTWKLWKWPNSDKVFYTPDEFKRFIEEEQLDEELVKHLPREEGKPVEKPAEAALRTKMTELMQKVQAMQRVMQEEPLYTVKPRGGHKVRETASTLVRDPNLDATVLILQELENEHEFLYNAVIQPVTQYIMEVLPEGARDTKPSELAYEDLEKMPPEDIMRICEWLTDKVDGFSARIKPEPKEVEEEEEEGIGDVDLFSLINEHTKLTINAKWLQHLQERLLGEDGNPRKTKDGEDPYHMGLVLEWVYGTIVSTAEKARDSAKKPLGMRLPTPQQAHDTLVHALQEQASWEQRARSAKELLKELLISRREAADLAAQYDTRPVPTTPGGGPPMDPPELPDTVILKMLQREVLLTSSKLHALSYEQAIAERKLRTLKSQLRQGEPEFERLKRELEEVKNAPRGLEGTFRTAAEMERHRAQLADAAIEEQLEVQTAFREHGARLQAIYDKRQRTDVEIARREQEMKQLQGWKQTVQSLIERFQDLIEPIQATLGDIEEGRTAEEAADGEQVERVQRTLALQQATQRITSNTMALQKLRSHFQKDVRRQLYSMDDDRNFFDWIQKELRAVERRLEDGRAVLAHLEGALINVSCDDPGAPIGQQLALPLLQERLDVKAREYAAQRAAAAEEAIIKEEEEKAERARLEREKRKLSKQKSKDRQRTEKEREKAEREAREAKEKEEAERAALASKERDELERKRKAEELENARRAEEELMEARRRELLSEENGYWRKRMAQELQQRALAEDASTDAKPEMDEGAEDSTMSTATQWKDEDGFKDEVRGPRKQRSRSGRVRAQARSADDLSDAEVAPREQPHTNGIAKLNGRPDSQGAGRGGHHDRDSKALENGGERAPRREARAAPAAERRHGERSGVKERPPVKVVTVPAPQDKPARPQPKQLSAMPVVPMPAATAAATPQARPAPAATAAQPSRPASAATPSQEQPAPVASAPEAVASEPAAPMVITVPAQPRVETQASQPLALHAQRSASSEPAVPVQRAVQSQPAPALSHGPQPQQQQQQQPQQQQVLQTPVTPVAPGVQVLRRLPRPIPLDEADGSAAAPLTPPMQVRAAPVHNEQQPVQVQEAPRPAVQPVHARPQPSQAQPSSSIPHSHIPLPPHNSAIAGGDPSGLQPRPGMQPGQQLHQQQQQQQPVPAPMYNNGQSALPQRPIPRRITAPSGVPPPAGPGPVHQMPGYSGPPSGPQLPPQHAAQPPLQHPHQQQPPQQLIPVPTRAVVPMRGPTKEQLQQQGPIHTPQPPQMQPPHMQTRGPRAPAESEWHQQQQPQQQLQPPPQQGFDPRQGHSQAGPGPMNHMGPHHQLPGQPGQEPRPVRPVMNSLPQHSHGRSPVRGPPSVGQPQHPIMMSAPPPSADSQPSGAPPPEQHHSVANEGHGPSQAHAIAQMQQHQQEAMHAAQMMGSGGPHEQQQQQPPQLPPGSGGGPPQMQQPGNVPGHFPGQRGPPGGAMPMMMYPPHMMMPGAPPPNVMPNGGGPPQGGPVFMGGPPPPYMVPMMPGMPVHHGGPMSAPVPQQQQQPPPHPQQFNGPMGPPAMPGLVPMGPGAPVAQHPGAGNQVMGPSGPRFAGPGQSGSNPGVVPGTTPRNTTTTLRASAPSFVPGGFKPAPAETKSPPAAAVHAQPKEASPSEELVAIAAASAAAAAAAAAAASQAQTAAQQTHAAPQTSSRDSAQSVAAETTARRPVQDVPHHNTSSAQESLRADDGPSSQQQRQSVPSTGIQSASQYQQQDPASSRGAEGAAQQQSVSQAGPAAGNLSSTSAQNLSALDRRNAGSVSSRDADSPPQTSRSQQSQGLQPSPNQRANHAPQHQQQQQPQQRPRWSAVAAQAADGLPSSGSGGRPTPPGSAWKNGPADGAQRRSAPAEASQADRGGQPSGSGRAGSQAGSSTALDRLGSTASSTSTVQLRSAGDKRKSMRAGGVLWEGMGLHEDLKRLRLVRGLSNDSGLNNCFLNVVIQGVWHLRSFREALLDLRPQDLEARGGLPEDMRVLRALWNIFNAFAEPREELLEAAADQAAQGASASSPIANGIADSDPKRAKRDQSGEASGSWTVSPTELREALSGLGKAAIRFELSEMHDASEVLGEIFNAIHRADLGGAAEKAADPQLPRKVRLPASGVSPAAAAAAIAAAEGKPMANGGGRSSSPPPLAQQSLVQRLFGLEMQVPAPPDDGEETGSASKRAKGSGGAVVGRWQEQVSRSASHKELRAAAAAGTAAGTKSGDTGSTSPGGTGSATKPARKPCDPNIVEVLRFTKYFHLVPAQGLRLAFDHMIGSRFEEMVREADVAETLAAGGSPPPSGTKKASGGAVQTAEMTLLRRPAVFTLAIVWDSPQASRDAIFSVVDSLAVTLDVGGVFKGVPAGPSYVLRTVVCYFGHHYQAYALSEELNKWLLFDDTNIKFIGSWREVAASMKEGRHQPSLLFYERVA
ncbi:probable inactive ubiquitin carboxyl-terminal hydrolase 54 at C-terminar half [Coccomyxa sp. Obi]|nr:probable inactive ubiquitin carboxyl-terminal hydrolase 54 at C-terminar half [Coccomyxa sp. Obi]